VTIHTTDWTLEDTEANSSGHARTIFALANGFIGMRGFIEEDSDCADQVFVNGFYETWPILYPEDAYGLARVGQTIQPAPNPGQFSLVVNGYTFDPYTSPCRDYRRTLSMNTGILQRNLTWIVPDGTQVRITSMRMVSAVLRGCVFLEYSVHVFQPAHVEISHWVSAQPRRIDSTGLDPRKSTSLESPTTITWMATQPDPGILVRTKNCGVGVACLVSYETNSHASTESLMSTDTAVGRKFSAELSADDTLTVSVRASFATDGPLFTDDARPVSDEHLLGQACDTLDRLRHCSRADLLDSHEQALTHWWHTADIVIEDDHDTQSALRWNLYQGFQASVCSEGLGIPAKGVTGGGYDGHTFWDAEAMVIPMLTYTHPELAKAGLRYRFSTLPRALQRAGELHHRGALFPWRSIDGREASAFFEAGTAQYHINADIAYAINRYLQATDDWSYLIQEGIDILVQTARLWVSLGFFDADGVFHIHQVTGPDEYSALVDDNLFTNVMAAANLSAAADWLDRLGRQDERTWTAVCRRLEVDDAELALWRNAAACVAIPYDEALGIHGQDAHFLSHAVWDFAGTPPQNHPLLLHYHPLTIYRHQVLKQADLILAQIHRPDLFTREQMKANFDYYDPLTTADSTLSTSAQAIMAAWVGHLDLADNYFHSSLAIDLADTHNNTCDGVHVAAAASVWSTVVVGFAGLRDYSGYSFDPCLPPGITRISFHLRLRGSLLFVAVTGDGISLRVISGDPLTLNVCGQQVTVSSDTIFRPSQHLML